MKTNFKRKLALSGLAIGVAALSVTASTFAWLTSNSVASTVSVSGTTGADKNLFVMGDADTVFSNTAKFKIATNDKDQFKFVNAMYNTTEKKFQTIGSVIKANDSSQKPDTIIYADIQMQTATTNQTEGVMQFNVKFQAPVNSSIYLSKADISSSDQAEFTLKADAGTGLNDNKKGDKLTVKLEDALTLAVNSRDDSGNNSDYSLYRNTEVKTNASYNALTYYNNVMNYNVSQVTPSYVAKKVLRNDSGVIEHSSDSNGILLLTTPADANNAYTQVKDEAGKLETANWITFYLYLDGWDNECFDAVRNQSLTAIFEFKLVTNGVK